MTVTRFDDDAIIDHDAEQPSLLFLEDQHWQLPNEQRQFGSARSISTGVRMPAGSKPRT